ncbi:MAG: hypothetical protein K2H90_01685, partial [Oscillospiraceae bacterium]|nr:hypothetical protein [Oscillospiraceae bacterium]
MLRKLKKAIPAIVSAVLCVTMVLGITASAASVWSETKALTTAKYNSNYIKWVEKYSEKDAKNTVTFGKSRTKKFYEKQMDAFNENDPQFALNMITKDEMVSVVYKGRKIKMVVYTEESGIAIYMNSKEMTMLSVSDKQKLKMPIPDDVNYDDLIDDMLDSYAKLDNDAFMAEDLGIADNEKGKLFKFKSGDNIYYYEQFETENEGDVGFLFDSKGNPLAMNADGLAACFQIKYTVKDYEFTVPK